MGFKIIDIQQISTDNSGSLQFFEVDKDISFPIKRIYYITNVAAGIKRGAHAHKQLLQLLFCPYGKIEILLDDGTDKVSVMLDSPNKGLVLTPSMWRDMMWHIDNSVLCVAASDFYSEEDYIRDYDDFIKYIKETKI